MSAKTTVLEGVFAINKPAAISSAQVLRDLQKRFNPSKTFAPWIAHEEANRVQESHNQRNKRSRRSRQQVQVKLGHGGTLDPAATGVLIIGMGSGTKTLSSFLECTKSYETIMLFGAATDTYDAEGKVVKRAGYEHITEQSVRDTLSQFRGNIKQLPPVFSALRVDGKRMYEYAREGKDIPKLDPRPVRVDELELLEWYPGGTHEHHWPAREAEAAEKEVMDKMLHSDDATKPKLNSAEAKTEDQEDAGTKRKRVDDESEATTDPANQSSDKKIKTDNDGDAETEQTSTADDTRLSTETSTRQPCPAPAAKIRMTVSSGFYVRSLCHDLGIALGSLGLMSNLVRTRQERFALGENVLEYDELAKGEEVWAPQVLNMLAEWEKTAPAHGNGKAQPQRNGQGSGRQRRNTSSEPDD